MRGTNSNNIRSALLISLSYYIFWLVVVFISSSANLASLAKGAGIYGWQIVFITFINLPLHLLVIPSIRTKKNKWLWVGLVCIAIPVVLIIGYRYWYNLGVSLMILPANNDSMGPLDFAMRNFVYQFFGLVYFAAIKFYLDSFQMKLQHQQLVIEKQHAELNYLKAQTNPHFLFNTLNNIYLLTRDRSAKAPESVLRLAGILRYMLYETTGTWVTIDKEIAIIEDYLELEKLRYDESLQLHFTTETDNLKQAVPPLLMLPLIENAFKHGVSESIGSPFINISLLINKQTLTLVIENAADASEAGAVVKENIGIRNLRRQLELLFTEYNLKVEARDRSFFVRLFINLASYAKN